MGKNHPPRPRASRTAIFNAVVGPLIVAGVIALIAKADDIDKTVTKDHSEIGTLTTQVDGHTSKLNDIDSYIAVHHQERDMEIFVLSNKVDRIGSEVHSILKVVQHLDTNTVFIESFNNYRYGENFSRTQTTNQYINP